MKVYVHKPVIVAGPVIMVAGQQWLHRIILNAGSMSAADGQKRFADLIGSAD